LLRIELHESFYLVLRSKVGGYEFSHSLDPKPTVPSVRDDGAVTVYDILHERVGAEWRQRVGAYCKLRLSPEWVAIALEIKGFKVRKE
jgi:hypothetical protein